MFWQIFSDMSVLQLGTLIVSALLIGINKTAVPGIGVLPVIMLALAFEGAFATGVQLLMLAFTDILAVAWYRRSADWKIILMMLPWALAGLLVGSVILHLLPDGAGGRTMNVIIGSIVLFLALVSFVRNRISPERMPGGRVIGAVCGMTCGITTHLANAAGPVAAVYFLAMRLPKEVYMGCSAWFFLMMNWIKLPIFTLEGRITTDSLKVMSGMIPFLVLGGVIGVVLLRRMNQRTFECVVQALVIVAAVILILK